MNESQRPNKIAIFVSIITIFRCFDCFRFPFYRIHPHPAIKASVSSHLSEVMEAVKNKDCSKFVCSQRLF